MSDEHPDTDTEACPKCGGPTEIGFGLAGGGYGAYRYCPECEIIVEKWQEDDEPASTKPKESE